MALGRVLKSRFEDSPDLLCRLIDFWLWSYTEFGTRLIVKMISNKPDSSKDTVLSSWMGKFDAIYFGEDENNLGTGHFWNDFNRPYSMVHTSIDFERY